MKKIKYLFLCIGLGILLLITSCSSSSKSFYKTYYFKGTEDMVCELTEDMVYFKRNGYYASFKVKWLGDNHFEARDMLYYVDGSIIIELESNEYYTSKIIKD